MIFNRNTDYCLMRKGLLQGLGVLSMLLLVMSGPAMGTDGELPVGETGHDHHAQHAAVASNSQGEQSTQGHLVEIAGAEDPHAHHRQMMQRKDYSTSVHSYVLPDLPLVAADGERTSLLDEVNTGEPVMLNFIFTTCTTICPVLSASFSQVQQQLGAERDQVRMISITIDPEHDTPERLRAYAARYHAGQQWQFLTGNLDDIVSIQKAFGAFRGTKANHEPFTFLRITPDSPWVRLDGLANASDIVKEYRQLVAEQEAIR